MWSPTVPMNPAKAWPLYSQSSGVSDCLPYQGDSQPNSSGLSIVFRCYYHLLTLGSDKLQALNVRLAERHEHLGDILAFLEHKLVGLTDVATMPRCRHSIIVLERNSVEDITGFDVYLAYRFGVNSRAVVYFSKSETDTSRT